MVKSCAVYKCTQRYEKGITFHQFPENETLLKQWLRAIRREDWTPSKFSLVCSKHFTEDCYEKNRWSMKKRLKLTAVPSVFSFPEQKEKLKLPPHETNLSDITDEPISSVEVGTEDPPESYQLQVKRRRKQRDDLELSNETVVKYITVSKETLSRKNRQIKMLQEDNRRLKKKLSNLEALVKHLKEKNLTSEEDSSALIIHIIP